MVKSKIASFWAWNVIYIGSTPLPNPLHFLSSITIDCTENIQGFQECFHWCPRMLICFQWLPISSSWNFENFSFEYLSPFSILCLWKSEARSTFIYQIAWLSTSNGWLKNCFVLVLGMIVTLAPWRSALTIFKSCTFQNRNTSFRTVWLGLIIWDFQPKKAVSAFHSIVK